MLSVVFEVVLVTAMVVRESPICVNIADNIFNSSVVLPLAIAHEIAEIRETISHEFIEITYCII